MSLNNGDAEMPLKKSDLLKEPIEHLDIAKYNVVSLVEAIGKIAFQARNLSRAAEIYDKIVSDTDCAVILTLAGSLFSAGLKRIVYDLIENNMVDVIVSTGANIVDQDFFEALGFKHYKGNPFVNDKALRSVRVDRIYDTFIDEDQLGVSDNTIAEIADSLEPRPYSSREILEEMGRYLVGRTKVKDSVILAAYQ